MLKNICSVIKIAAIKLLKFFFSLFVFSIYVYLCVFITLYLIDYFFFKSPAPPDLQALQYINLVVS